MAVAGRQTESNKIDLIHAWPRDKISELPLIRSVQHNNPRPQRLTLQSTHLSLQYTAIWISKQCGSAFKTISLDFPASQLARHISSEQLLEFTWLLSMLGLCSRAIMVSFIESDTKIYAIVLLLPQLLPYNVWMLGIGYIIMVVIIQMY